MLSRSGTLTCTGASSDVYLVGGGGEKISGWANSAPEIKKKFPLST